MTCTFSSYRPHTHPHQPHSFSGWSGLGALWDARLSNSMYYAILRQHSISDTALHKKSLCEWYLANHPAPSWRHVADALYRGVEHGVLEVVRDQVQYLKGIYVMYNASSMIRKKNSPK